MRSVLALLLACCALLCSASAARTLHEAAAHDYVPFHRRVRARACRQIARTRPDWRGTRPAAAPALHPALPPTAGPDHRCGDQLGRHNVALLWALIGQVVDATDRSQNSISPSNCFSRPIAAIMRALATFLLVCALLTASAARVLQEAAVDTATPTHRRAMLQATVVVINEPQPQPIWPIWWWGRR